MCGNVVNGAAHFGSSPPGTSNKTPGIAQQHHQHYRPQAENGADFDQETSPPYTRDGVNANGDGVGNIQHGVRHNPCKQ